MRSLLALALSFHPHAPLLEADAGDAAPTGDAFIDGDGDDGDVADDGLDGFDPLGAADDEPAGDVEEPGTFDPLAALGVEGLFDPDEDDAPDQPAEAEAVSAETGPDAAAAETPAADAEPAPVALAESLAARIAAAIPEAVVSNEDELVERFTGLETANREMREVQDRIADVIERAPALAAVLDAMLADPKLSVEEAVAAHLDGVDVVVPDRYLDPDGHDAAIEKKTALKLRKEQTAKEASDREAYIRTYQGELNAAADALAAKLELDDAGAARFFGQIKRFEKGDPQTGRFVPAAEKLEGYRKMLAYDADVKAAEERGKVAGRLEAERTLKGKRDQAAGKLPRLTGATLQQARQLPSGARNGGADMLTDGPARSGQAGIHKDF
jgi:hypothetical protein